MLKIEAYIRPSSLPAFHRALVNVGVKGISVWQTKGIGKQYHESVKREVFRGAEIKDIYIDRVRLEAVIEDSEKDEVVEALKSCASGNDLGTLRVFVTPVLEALRVPDA